MKKNVDDSIGLHGPHCQPSNSHPVQNQAPPSGRCSCCRCILPFPQLRVCGTFGQGIPPGDLNPWDSFIGRLTGCSLGRSTRARRSRQRDVVPRCLSVRTTEMLCRKLAEISGFRALQLCGVLRNAYPGCCRSLCL